MPRKRRSRRQELLDRLEELLGDDELDEDEEDDPPARRRGRGRVDYVVEVPYDEAVRRGILEAVDDDPPADEDPPVDDDPAPKPRARGKKATAKPDDDPPAEDPPRRRGYFPERGDDA